jgi:hypothetical protein
VGVVASRMSKAVEVTGQVFGLFAGLAILVYLTGSAVLALRLGFENLPWDAVISQLPREFVIAVGLTTVVLPAVVLATLYVAWRLYKGAGATPPSLKRWDKASTGERWGIVGIGALVAACLVLPGTVIEYLKEDLRTELLWAVLAGLVTWAWVLLILNLRSRLAEGRANGEWNRLSVSAVMAGLAAACVVPGCVMVGATIPLLDVKVCTAAGAGATGSLVGETADDIYFGVGDDDTSPRQIVVIPSAEVKRVVIGERAHVAPCPPAAAEAAGG